MAWDMMVSSVSSHLMGVQIKQFWMEMFFLMGHLYKHQYCSTNLPVKKNEGDPKVKDFKGSSFFVWITPDGHNERMNA